MASTYLSRTLGTPTDENRWTYSCWVKNSTVGQYGYFLQTGTNDSNNLDAISIDGGNFNIRVYGYPGSLTWQLATNSFIRDVNGWYHIVVAYNSDEATASDRVKLWINGEQPSLSASTYPSSGANSGWINKSGAVYYIGSNIAQTDYSSMLMSHIHFIDGTAYTASTFGESDANGVWKPKTAPSVTYGTNGFFLKFENSGSMGTDSSGNANNFTVNGSLTQTLDTPSNVYATWNALGNPTIASGTAYVPTFSNGNTTVNNADASQYTGSPSTLGVNTGKWYAELKCSAVGSQAYIGLLPDNDYGQLQRTCLYENNGNFDGSAYGSTYTAGDILQIAFDANNGTLWFGKNGTWQNSATQSEIENGTTTNSAITSLDMTKFWHIATKGYNGATFQANFGNGYFGTTAVSSAGSNGNGSIFEYDVPTGFYALNTKNIAQYG